MTRKQFLQRAAMLAALGNIMQHHAEGKSGRKIKIGACDWSLGKSSNLEAFTLAKQIGLQGIQVSLGSVDNNLHLRQRSIQESFIQASRDTEVKIASLAIGELNKVPYKSEPQTDQWVWDSVEVARNLDVDVVLLAFFGKNDLRNDEQGKKEVIRKLKHVAPHAEKNKITLGIESYLTAEEHMDIIQQVGSKSIKVFYDFRNAADAGNDVLKELKYLTKHNICEIHMKENGVPLAKGTMDWNAIASALIDMNYYGDGWMQIEWASPKDADIISCYKDNLAFLQKSFSY